MRSISKKVGAIGITLLLLTGGIPQMVAGLWHRIWGQTEQAVTFIAQASAEAFYKREETLSLLFPDAKETRKEVKVLSTAQKKAIAKTAQVEFHPDLDKEFTFYVGLSKEKRVIGYVCVTSAPGKWGTIDYAVGITPKGEVGDILILSLSERRGRVVKERKFLDQFKAKTVTDPLQLKRDVKGVAGATISSRAMTEGIRKVLHVFKEFYLPK